MATSVTDEEAERIDAFLGDGTYDDWHNFDVESDQQLRRAKNMDARLWHIDHALSVLSPYGTSWVEKLQNDCAWAIDLIKQKKFPDPTQFNPLLKIFPAALDAADSMLTAAEAIPTLWLVAGAAAVPWAGFTAAAGQLHRDILELEELLSDAQAEEVEAEIKSLLGVAITTFELFAPGISLLAKGGLSLTEIYLSGVTTPAAGSKYAKFGFEGTEHVMEKSTEKAIEHAKEARQTIKQIERLEEAGHKVQFIPKAGGKALTIAGFYFDVDEVLHAKGNVKRIKALMEKANKEYKEIKEKITAAAKGYQRLQNILVTREAAERREIEDKIHERDDLVGQYSYSLVTPVAWKLVDDYSKYSR